ncbi:pyrimidodiazepine synthase-like [Physella acuta]|uniref:pyrimidodiazepine synthase-like n=1 Tax=Physella acuta TaxID=109671 RepID=UPI0027DAC2C4|nr:pyrimidodiazepine synthase-like [Physella acuta]
MKMSHTKIVNKLLTSCSRLISLTKIGCIRFKEDTFITRFSSRSSQLFRKHRTFNSALISFSVLTVPSYSQHLRSNSMSNPDELRGPEVPLLPGQVLRLYSMRMCPYAQRVRLILAAKGIKYDLVNVDLNTKPDWFFDLNPSGEVPVVVYEGGHIYESLVTAEFLDDIFPEPPLYATDPLVKAYEKIYFNHWTKKGIPAFYSLLWSGYSDPEQSRRLEENIQVLDGYLKKLGKPYFHGEQVGFSDYMIWPWFERMPMLKDVTNFTICPLKYPHITAWVDRMWQDPVVQACMTDRKMLTVHYEKYRTGKPDFTIGSVKLTNNVVQDPLENLDGLRDPATRDRQK